MAPHSTATAHIHDYEVSADLVWHETDLDGSKHLSHESVSSLFHTWTTEDCFLSLHSLQESPATNSKVVRQILEGLDDDLNHLAADILELPPLSQRGPKRPLCTFMNFRGTRSDTANRTTTTTRTVGDDDDDAGHEGLGPVDMSSASCVSLPSLDDEEYLTTSTTTSYSATIDAAAAAVAVANEDEHENQIALVFCDTKYAALKKTVSLEVPHIPQSQLEQDEQLNEYVAKIQRLVAKVKQVQKEIQEEEDEQQKGNNNNNNKKQRLF